MAIHFAAKRGPAAAPVARILAVRSAPLAANDNGSMTSTPEQNDKLLRAALNHFGQHGLGAARAAREQVEKAVSDSDQQGYDWWLGITRTFDRRLAREIEQGVPFAQTKPSKAS
ncbi:MAG: hypothetical protein AAF250_12265 [Pseudomonadota bacterium]